MKTKKNKLSLDSLALNKETVFNLSNDQMKNLVGGVTEGTNNHCQSNPTYPQICETSIAACSINTHCYSVCEPNCTTTGTGTDTFLTLELCNTVEDCTYTCPVS